MLNMVRSLLYCTQKVQGKNKMENLLDYLTPDKIQQAVNYGLSIIIPATITYFIGRANGRKEGEINSAISTLELQAQRFYESKSGRKNKK